MSTTEDQIKKMYEAQLSATKSQLQTDYESALSELDETKKTQQQNLARNLKLTKTEAAKAAVGNEEYYAASGLSSGGRAQARLAQENQLQADLTALRTAQQRADADIERQRSLLAKEFSNAITEAQAANDLEKAQALYQQAKEAEAQLLAKQEAAAGLMAQTGDYTRYGDLYGLSADEIKKLTNLYNGQTGSSGSYTGSSGSYTGSSGSYTGGSAVNNGNRTKGEIIAMQRQLGVTADGQWGPVSQAAARKLWGTTDADDAWTANNKMLQEQYDAAEEAKKAFRNSLEGNMNGFISSGASKSEINSYLTSAYKDGYITQSEYNQLKQQYLPRGYTY